MNFVTASLQDIIEFLDACKNLEYTSNTLVIEYQAISDSKTELKIKIAYEIVVARRACSKAIKYLDKYKAEYDFEQHVGI